MGFCVRRVQACTSTSRGSCWTRRASGRSSSWQRNATYASLEPWWISLSSAVSPGSLRGASFAALATVQVAGRVASMFGGECINNTERRSVLHVALRKPRGSVLKVGGVDVVAEVHKVLDAIKDFSAAVRLGGDFTNNPDRLFTAALRAAAPWPDGLLLRDLCLLPARRSEAEYTHLPQFARLSAGRYKGSTGKPLTNVICIGIGGSYLGSEFLVEALKTEPRAAKAAEGRQIR